MNSRIRPAELRPVTARPRALRDLERIRRAAAAAGARPNRAMAAALAQIGAAFDEAAAVNDFKLRVERLLHLGPRHPAVRARFGARADRLGGRSLEAAVVLTERWWRDERRAFAIASAFGCGSRLSLEVLSELRLVLRLLRRKRMDAEYAAALAALDDMPLLVAAE
jgi:hypothetical protein